MTQVLEYASAQSVGKRQRQEDRCAFFPPEGPGIGRIEGSQGLLAVLADGMGGHSGGDLAAMLTVEAVIGCLRDEWALHPAGLRAALDAATAELSRRKASGVSSDMGATLVAAIIRSGRLYWVSVGDSHLYRISGSTLMKLNADHSMGPILDAAARRGEISIGEARTSGQRNVLLSAVTGEPVRKVDLAVEGVVLSQGDWVIAASDGLDVLPADVVARTVGSASGAEEACRALLDLVEREGDPRQDNTTVMCVKVAALDERDSRNDTPGMTRPMREDG